MSTNLECKTHNGQPIMFICLDNNCEQKLFCFRCCQQYRKEHSFIKYTDFMHNLEAYLNHSDFVGDSKQKINSTQQIEGQQIENGQKKETHQIKFERKPSIKDEDNLILQCVKGVNADQRNGKVWEECEQAKDEFKIIQQQYIDQLFDKQMQELNSMIEKARESILNKYFEYIDNMLASDQTMSKAQDNKAIKLILEASKMQDNTHESLNAYIAKLHQGQMHIQFQKEKITKKINELNYKLDGFFAQIQNRITFSLNTCNNVFQPMKVNAAAAAAIQKIFANNQIPRHSPGDFRFSLRSQLNTNKMFQSQLTQQQSLSTSQQSSTTGGASSRISFRIKHVATKKQDNYHSLSPSNQQQTNTKIFKPSQITKISPSKINRPLISEISNNSKVISPKTQQVGLFKGVGKNVKINNYNFQTQSARGGDEDKEFIKIQVSQSIDEELTVSQELNQKKNEDETSQQFQKTANANCNLQIINQKQDNANKAQHLKPYQRSEKPNQTVQIYSQQSQEKLNGEEHQQLNSISVLTHNLEQIYQQSKQAKTLKKSPKNLNLINHKIGAGFGDELAFNDEKLQMNALEEENSKLQDRHKYHNAQFDINHNFLFPDNVNKLALLKQTNQIKNVVETQKLQINQMNSQGNNSQIIKLSETQMQQQQPKQILSTIFPEQTSESYQEIQYEEYQQDNFQNHNNQNNVNQNQKKQEDRQRPRLQSSHQSG